MAVRGELVNADKVYHEMSKIGSDANFALNFPAGYVEVPVKSGHTGDSAVSRRLVVSKTILCALYGWSFRLNRQKKKGYSDAGMAYMAIVWSRIINKAKYSIWVDGRILRGSESLARRMVQTMRRS